MSYRTAPRSLADVAAAVGGGLAVVALEDGTSAIQTVCQGCSKALTLPCRLENDEVFQPDRLAFQWATMVVCADCAERNERERAERELASSVTERVRAAGIPKSFHGLRFDDMDKDGARGSAVAAAWAWADSDNGGVFLHGSPGTGKTRLAATALWHRLQRAPAAFCSVAHLIAALQASFNDSDRKAALGVLTGSGPLVLDDIDKVKPSEQVLSQLFVAIDRRVQAQAPLFVTSNAPPALLSDRFGAAITSRLVGYCQVFELIGRDRRLRQHAEGGAA